MLIALLLIVVSTAHAALSSAEEGSGERGLTSKEAAAENEKLAHLMLRSASACTNSSEMATFIRVPQALVMGIPTIVSTAEMTACAAFCRNNTEPLSGLSRPCKGFNFQSNIVPTCEFFDDQSKVGALNRNVGERSYYFDKVCLPEGDYCGDRSFAFDVIANARLDGEVTKEVSAQDRSDCLAMCLNATDFTCHAVNFDIKRKSCELYSTSRRSMGSNFSTDVQDVDYYENNCLDKETRCPSGQIGFVKLAHTGIRGFDVNAGVKLLADCLLDCIESRVLFCRSVEYDADSNECYISEEDTVTSEEHIVTDPAVSVDLFEPFCLPSVTESKCAQSYIYEKLRATYMHAAQTLTTLVDLKLENCLLACMNHAQCRALNFDKLTGNCELLPFGRTNQTVSLKAVANIDFYELTCSRESDGSSFFTSGRLPRKSSISPFLLLKHDASSIDAAPSPTPEWKPDSTTTTPSAAVTTPSNSSSEFALWTEVNKKRPLASLTDKKVKRMKTEEAPFDDLTVTSSENATNSRGLTSSPPVYGICGFRFQAQDRRIKIEYRTDRLNIETLKQCQRLCEITTEFHCVSVSYSLIGQICGLSDFNLEDYPLDELTEDDDGSNFYGREVCLLQNDDSKELDDLTPAQSADGVTFAAPITPPPPSPLVSIKRDSTGTARAPAPPSASPNAPPSSTSSTGGGQPPAARPDALLPPARPPLTTRSVKEPTSSSPPPLRPSSPAPRPRLSNDAERRIAAADIARQRSVPRQIAVGNTLAPDDITVEAICLKEGVNITITIERGTYTGAAYAAERFSECRNIVLAKSEFWLYLPRPATNSACNTLEVNDIMTGVIVISNDRVLPHDVTTKGDLFYQISCNYSIPPLPVERRFFFRAGVVVGGPEPRLVSAEELERPARDLDVRMKILRNGRAVDSVLIGEQLTLSIESSEPAKNMKLIDCNVTRIGGGSPAPSPLRLVEEGCASMSQIMGPIKHGSKGLEASLTAFRIDGSAEIEIDCEVMFCREGCPEAVCEGDNNSIESGKKRRRRAIVRSVEEGQMIETVDGRLRVFMEGEKGAPNWKDIASSELQFDSRTYGRRCMSETVFMVSVGCLGAVLFIVVVAFCCLFRQKSLIAQLIHASTKSVGSSSRPAHSDYISTGNLRFGICSFFPKPGLGLESNKHWIVRTSPSRRL